MSDPELTVAKKYYGTVFESSLAVAGGHIFIMLLFHKPPKIKLEDIPWGCHSEG